MSDCSSDPAAGCDNSQIVTAIEDCCAEQGAKLDLNNTKLDEIKAANAACCASMTAKQDTMIYLLSVIAGVPIPTTTTLPVSTTTTSS